MPVAPVLRPLFLVLAGLWFAQASPPDVTGVWETVFETPMGERTYMTSFVREKDGLIVVMKTPQGRELNSTGKLEGDKIEWTVVVSGPMGEIRLGFKGKVEGEEIAGTVTMDEVGESPFKARRVFHSEARRSAGIFPPADRSGFRDRPPGGRRPRARPISRPSDNGPARGRPDDSDRLPKGPWPRAHRL